MLWKDDSFEVVFDPGTDEVEKQGLGPAPAHCRDTGWTPRFLSRNAAQPRANQTAKLHHSIGRVGGRQFHGILSSSLGTAELGTIGVGTDALVRAGRALLGRVFCSLHHRIPI